MESQRFFFGSNIKFLRERIKISQESLALKLAITRAKLVAIEIGQTKAPQPEDYIKFSEFFKISIDSLLKVNLAILGELKVRELEAGNDVYMAGGNIRVLAITVDKSNKENIEYVPIKAKAGYLAGHRDPEFIAALPKYSFPGLPANGTYRLFPTTGDSMLPIPENSDVLAKYIQNWNDIKPEALCIVVLRNPEDFVFKKVTVLEDVLMLSSLNPSYKTYSVPVTEVLEIWRYEKFISKHLPEANIELAEIKKMLVEIKWAWAINKSGALFDTDISRNYSE